MTADNSKHDLELRFWVLLRAKALAFVLPKMRLCLIGLSHCTPKSEISLMLLKITSNLADYEKSDRV